MKDYLSFQVKSSVRLAVPADWVVETLTLNSHEICPIPGVNGGILGVVNYQEQLVWVMDLGEYLTHLLGLGSGCLRDENSLAKDKLINQSSSNLGNNLSNNLGNNLTGVAIALPRSQSEKCSNLPPLIWVVSELQGVVSLNSAQFRPLPSQFMALLGNYFNGLTEIPVSGSKNCTTVAILNVNGLLSALESLSRKVTIIEED